MNQPAFFVSLALALPLGAVVTLAEPAAGHFGGRAPGARLERRLEKLGLDAAQMDKVHAILDASKQTRQETRKQLRAAFDQMQSLLEQEPPDEAAIMQQVEKIGQLKIDKHKAMLHTLLEVRAILTPEQRQQLKEMKHRAGPRWRHRHRPPAD